MVEDVSRRRLLGATAGGFGALAGCSGGGGAETTQSGNAPAAVKEWLAEVSNFDGSLTDRTGSSPVRVDVGTEANGGYYGFSPAAVRVGTGTTVTWEWTERGGQHNVVADGGAFTSGRPQLRGSFEHAFESAGTYLYLCEPHEFQQMKGAVVVE